MGHDALVSGLSAIATIVVFILIWNVGGMISRVAKEKQAEKAQEVSGVEKAPGTHDVVVRGGHTVAVGRVAVDSHSHVAAERSEAFSEHYYQRDRDSDRDDYYQPGIDGPRITHYYGPSFEEANRYYTTYFETALEEAGATIFEQFVGVESESGSPDQEINILTSPHTVGHCREYPEDCPRYRG